MPRNSASPFVITFNSYKIGIYGANFFSLDRNKLPEKEDLFHRAYKSR